MPAKEPYPPRAIAWYTTILLSVLYWLSILDRFIISLLVDPIQRDLGITDVQFGLLHGLAFAVTFSLFGLVAGALADRLSRRSVIFASVSIWSLATAACGLASHFWHLLIARVGVGAGEAGLNPCATSMISDMFPRSLLTSAMAVFSVGASVGAGCAYLLGGLIVSLVAQADTINLPIFGEVRSWQAVFLIVGLPGVLIALLVFTTPEPRRRETHQVKTKAPLLSHVFQNYVQLLSFMRTRSRYYLCHYTGFGIAAIALIGGGAWFPAHMSRTFGWGADQIGLSLGILLVGANTIGNLVCGYFVDLMYRRGHRDAQFTWYALALLAALPCGVIAATSDSPWVFLGGIGLFLALTSPMPTCSNAALNLVTPNRLRGSGIAFYASTSGLIGLSLGPLLIAAISDYLLGGDAIGDGLAITIAVCCPLAAIILILGRAAMREAVTAAEDLEK